MERLTDLSEVLSVYAEVQRKPTKEQSRSALVHLLDSLHTIEQLGHLENLKGDHMSREIPTFAFSISDAWHNANLLVRVVVDLGWDNLAIAIYEELILIEDLKHLDNDMYGVEEWPGHAIHSLAGAVRLVKPHASQLQRLAARLSAHVRLYIHERSGEELPVLPAPKIPVNKRTEPLTITEAGARLFKAKKRDDREAARVKMRRWMESKKILSEPVKPITGENERTEYYFHVDQVPQLEEKDS